jgi:hypothetical protein
LRFFSGRDADSFVPLVPQQQESARNGQPLPPPVQHPGQETGEDRAYAEPQPVDTDAKASKNYTDDRNRQSEALTAPAAAARPSVSQQPRRRGFFSWFRRRQPADTDVQPRPSEVRRRGWFGFRRRHDDSMRDSTLAVGDHNTGGRYS